MKSTSPANESLARYIDHTLLNPQATKSDILKACEEAKQYQFKGVCVASSWVPLVAEELRGTPVLTVAVVGFPHGNASTEAITHEAEVARITGAQEVDMVFPLGLLKGKQLKDAENHIRNVVTAAQVPVKVILESHLLNDEEIVQACIAAENAGAAFVKTSTGFSDGGATVHQINVMREAVTSKVKIKASGGIRTADDAWALIQAGAHRLGTSRGVSLMTTTQGEKNDIVSSRNY